jgi:hypothetical protein
MAVSVTAATAAQKPSRASAPDTSGGAAAALTGSGSDSESVTFG